MCTSDILYISICFTYTHKLYFNWAGLLEDNTIAKNQKYMIRHFCYPRDILLFTNSFFFPFLTYTDRYIYRVYYTLYRVYSILVMSVTTTKTLNIIHHRNVTYIIVIIIASYFLNRQISAQKLLMNFAFFFFFCYFLRFVFYLIANFRHF